jgi:hypothetical protein
MKWIVKTVTFFLLFCSFSSYGQQQTYRYQRELPGVTDQWHKVVLPEDIFGQVSPDLSDLRIFGVTANHDTIEVPYLLRVAREEVINIEVPFKTLNTAHNEEGYFFSFEVPTNVAVNQIKLNFVQQNFDWRLRLEGSQDQNIWYTIVEDYRILSIKKGGTDFQFTDIKFPLSKYGFFRLLVNSKEEPKLASASIAQREVTAGSYHTYPLEETIIRENKSAKQTEIALELASAVPVSRIKIAVLDTIDYYRPVTIQYLTDSVETAKGWKYNYLTLGTGTLNSLKENEFQFRSNVISKKLKILIHNQDNRPLTTGDIAVNGYVHELVARFTEKASYQLVYGNKRIGKPHYDIDRFQDKIPYEMTALALGAPQVIPSEEPSMTVPLFENKIWLWAIMLGIILLLGWFSLKMMNAKGD